MPASSPILVTGATGFVGGHVARRLVQDGRPVAAVSRAGSVKPRDLADAVEWVAADDAVEWIARRTPQAVIHIATCYDAERTSDMVRANLLFPLELLEASLRTGCRLFASTDTFFGKAGMHYPHMQAYTRSKHDFTTWARLAAQAFADSRLVNLRLEHVYGPQDGPRKFIPQLTHRLREHETCIDLTPGDQQRDFVFVADVAQAFLTVLQQAPRLPAGFTEIEVGSGQAVPLRRFVEVLADSLGSRSALNFGALAHRPGEIMHSAAAPGWLQAVGWTARTSLNDGIRQTIEAAS